MTSENNVVDFIDVKMTRDAIGDLSEQMSSNLRVAISAVATMHGGKPDDWIEAKTAVCVDVMNAMLAEIMDPVPVLLPTTLSDEDKAAIQSEFAKWAFKQNEACLKAFATRLVEIFGP